MLHAPEAVDAMALEVYQAQCQATRFRSKSISMTGGLQSRLARYDGRLLLVWGEHDVTAVPQTLAPAIAAIRSGWEWRLLAGGGHWVQYECHEPVNQLLGDWFESEV
jgi:pimeloyl-ACP methyl ester carboxylesterase